MSTPMGNSTPGTGWNVTSQAETAKVNGSGQIEDGITVGFRTQHGQSGSVWIPKSGYNASMVRAAISELAATMDDVHNLSG